MNYIKISSQVFEFLYNNVIGFFLYKKFRDITEILNKKIVRELIMKQYRN